MDKKEIGSSGKILNLSSASRAMNIEPDEEQIEKFDEYEDRKNPLRYITLFLTMITFTYTIYLFYSGHWVWGIIMIPIIIFLGLLTSSLGKTMLTKRIAYQQGLIISAIIVELKPIKIIALANVSSDSDQKTIWGCQILTLKDLPNHQMVIGEKVPCVSLFGMPNDRYWRHFEPRPIAWGYKDSKIIKETIEFITEDSGSNNEWDILNLLVDKIDMNKEKEVKFFNEDLKEIML